MRGRGKRLAEGGGVMIQGEGQGEKIGGGGGGHDTR